MHAEDLIDPGDYLDPETGDIWEKRRNGKWYVNGVLHKPFPHSLVPEHRTGQHSVTYLPAVSVDDAVREAVEQKRKELGNK